MDRVAETVGITLEDWVYMYFKPRKQHIYHEKNLHGKDFVVGDIHGQAELLYRQLYEMGFDFQSDRLFCTGDLISKGASSIDCLNLLTKKWFFSVMGNHEQLFLLGFQSSMYWQCLRSQKGGWLSSHLHRFDLLLRWKTLIEIAMPLTRTVELGSVNVGISHASSIASWEKTRKESLSNEEIWQILWSRPLQERESCRGIAGVDYVVHGHSPVGQIINIDNRYWIDTFRLKSRFTILELRAIG